MNSLFKIATLLIFLLVIANVSASTITVTGMPSKSGYGYSWATTTWENYCPLCGAHGYLADNPKGVVEGEVTCLRCDADYCSVTGLDKAHYVRGGLTRAKSVIFKFKAPFLNLYSGHQARMTGGITL